MLPYHPLDSPEPGLDLPAVIWAPIVFNSQFYIPHEVSLLTHPS